MRTLRRVAAMRALWEALRASRRPGTPGIQERVAAVPRLLRATASGAYPADRKRLGLIALALVYVVSPVDLVPEALLWGLGIGDDALALAWLVGALLAETETFLEWERSGGRTVPGVVIGDDRRR